jgi:hypothetical protein
MSFGFSTGHQLPELIWTPVVWNPPHEPRAPTAKAAFLTTGFLQSEFGWASLRPFFRETAEAKRGIRAVRGSWGRRRFAAAKAVHQAYGWRLWRSRSDVPTWRRFERGIEGGTDDVFFFRRPGCDAQPSHGFEVLITADKNIRYQQTSRAAGSPSWSSPSYGGARAPKAGRNRGCC